MISVDLRILSRDNNINSYNDNNIIPYRRVGRIARQWRCIHAENRTILRWSSSSSSSSSSHHIVVELEQYTTLARTARPLSWHVTPVESFRVLNAAKIQFYEAIVFATLLFRFVFRVLPNFTRGMNVYNRSSGDRFRIDRYLRGGGGTLSETINVSFPKN